MITTLLVILSGATLVYFFFLAKAIKTIETERKTDVEPKSNYTKNDIISLIKAHDQRFDKIEESISLLLLNNVLEDDVFSSRERGANYKWHLYSTYLTKAFDTKEINESLDWGKVLEGNKKVEEDIEVTPSFDNRSTYQLY